MNRKAMEMTVSTIIAFVIGLVLLAIGIFLIYTKIVKPSEGVTSVITCQARGGIEVPSCQGQVCAICIKLPSETSKELVNCCIREK